MSAFLMDGVSYNVLVSKLTRKFSVLDTEQTGRTQDGHMYRDIIGTYYNYTMVVEPVPGDQAAMDSFWDAVSQPVESHLCQFPYNQDTLTQRMYVTSGEQNIIDKTASGTRWGELTLNYIAMSPEVVP